MPAVPWLLGRRGPRAEKQAPVSNLPATRAFYLGLGERGRREAPPARHGASLVRPRNRETRRAPVRAGQLASAGAAGRHGPAPRRHGPSWRHPTGFPPSRELAQAPSRGLPWLAVGAEGRRSNSWRILSRWAASHRSKLEPRAGRLRPPSSPPLTRIGGRFGALARRARFLGAAGRSANLVVDGAGQSFTLLYMPPMPPLVGLQEARDKHWPRGWSCLGFNLKPLPLGCRVRGVLDVGQQPRRGPRAVKSRASQGRAGGALHGILRRLGSPRLPDGRLLASRSAIPARHPFS